MLCPYIRSSSANQYKTCEMRYFFEYVLGLKSPTGKKACLGTIFHKTMEVRSLTKKAMQENKTSFTDDNFGELTIAQGLNFEYIHDLSFNFYKKAEPKLIFDDSDYKTVLKWITNTLSKYPDYDPINLDIVEAELFFDIPIDRPWAYYDTNIGGQQIKGQLHIKGTMDTVVRLSDNVYELVDYKTGAYRKDFATGEEKDLEYLKNDVQLLLYLIALKETYPDKHFILSLFYINNGGIFSVAADDEMLDRAWKMLEKTYKSIIKNNCPSQLDKDHKDFRCRLLCPFSKKMKDQNQVIVDCDDATAEMSVCNYFKQQISKKGLIKTTTDNINLKTFGSYGSGGGRIAE